MNAAFRPLSAAVAAIAALFLPLAAFGQVPQIINYQGRRAAW